MPAGLVDGVICDVENWRQVSFCLTLDGSRPINHILHGFLIAFAEIGDARLGFFGLAVAGEFEKRAVREYHWAMDGVLIRAANYGEIGVLSIWPKTTEI
jgi:hypothetical protein